MDVLQNLSQDEKATATLIAATLAALISLLSVIINQRGALIAERREQYRALLLPHIEKLGTLIHQIVATARVVAHRISEGQEHKKYRELCAVACKDLSELRPKVKYPLWGLDDDLKALRCVGSWLLHLDTAKQASELTDKAETLRRRLDKTLMRAFLHGQAPGWWDRFWCHRATSALTKKWASTRPASYDATGDTEVEA